MARIMSPKKAAAVTEKGKAMWAFVSTPDKRWKAEGEYKVNLIMDKGKDAAKLIADLEAVRDEFYDIITADMKPAQLKKVSKREVYSDFLDADGEETGEFEFKFSCNAGGVRKDGTPWTARVGIYDAKLTKVTKKMNIGNNSIIQVNYTPSAYMLNTDSSVGVKCYLNDVMVHKLVDFGGTPAFAASDASDGFTYDEGAPQFTPAVDPRNEQTSEVLAHGKVSEAADVNF